MDITCEVECTSSVGEEMEADLCTFSVGILFESFTKLEEKVMAYKAKAFCKRWKREARTIEAARKCIGRALKPELKYCCIHRGQALKPKGKGKRSI